MPKEYPPKGYSLDVKFFIGVDPGASGGIATIDTSFLINLQKMPSTDRDILDHLYTFHQGIAVLEKVGGYIGSGQPGSAMFKFGANYGALKMALVASEIPFIEVTPQKWQKSLGITPRRKNESKTQWKNRLKAFAQQLFPKESITLATCDALLIAEYCRRSHLERNRYAV